MGAPYYELAEGGVRAEITVVFEKAATSYGYRPTFLGADRHGSFVWEASRVDDIVRSITVSFTPVGGNYVVDTWVSGSDGERFMHDPIVKPVVMHPDGIYPFVEQESGGLKFLVRQAVRTANDIQDEDLEESYSLAAAGELAPKD